MAAVIAILVILILLFVGVMRRLPGVADRAACSANLRTLRVGLEAYLQDNNHWPRPPVIGPNAHDAEANWWIKTLGAYDVPAKAWQCPAIIRLGKIQQHGMTPKIHYSVMLFDMKPRTPYMWPNMPWVVENGNVHGRGPLCVMPDGSVRNWDDLFAEQSK